MASNEQTPLDTVLNFLESYAKRSVEGCMAAMAVSKPILLFGTNENEVFRTIDDVRQALTRDFGSMANIRLGERRNTHVESSPTLASVIVELPISFQNDENHVETLFRYALTLTLEGDQWKICSGMASVPFEAGTYSFTQ